MKKFICLILIVIVVPICSGCGKTGEIKTPGQTSGNSDKEQNSAENNSHDLIQDGIDKDNSETDIDMGTEKVDRVERILKSMSLEEKVGQVFIASFRRNSKGEPLLKLDKDTFGTIKKYALGGVILFSENIDNIAQTQKLIKDMQKSTEIPLFIGVDEEGGRVSRLNSSGKIHATSLPANMLLGETGDPQLAYEVGEILGRETGSLGFNINFAPVADINTNPENPVIGDRSFGTEPAGVALMVEATVRGIQDQNVSAVLKHFPGHGDTHTDSHTGEVIIKHDRERLENIEFVPFKKGINAGVDGIMTAHIQMPEITGHSLPATLSSKILKEILRDELGYSGLIITDALEMGAISNYWSAGEAAVKAFKAGADVLLMPSSLEEAYNALFYAVRQEEISIKRLDESVRRILLVKQKRKLFQADPAKKEDPEMVLGNSRHQAIAAKIYKGKGIR